MTPEYEADLFRKAAMSPAYSLPLPLSYMTATGAIAAQWGYFEMQFIGFIRILSRSPELAPLAEKIPRGFADKADLVRKLARKAFANCPSLAEKICDLATRANEIGRKRNAVIHGFWFDMTPFEGVEHRGVTLMTEPDGTGDYYSVTLDQLEKLAAKISDLKLEGLELTFPPVVAPARLTPDEVNALQAHHKNFPGPTQEAPARRDPNRKGLPMQPAPFEA